MAVAYAGRSVRRATQDRTESALLTLINRRACRPAGSVCASNPPLGRSVLPPHLCRPLICRFSLHCISTLAFISALVVVPLADSYPSLLSPGLTVTCHPCPLLFWHSRSMSSPTHAPCLPSRVPRPIPWHASLTRISLPVLSCTHAHSGRFAGASWRGLRRCGYGVPIWKPLTILATTPCTTPA